MLRLIFALVLAGLPDKPETQKLARSILATHEQNLASLTIYGSIHFQETDGVIQGPIDVNRMVPPPKQKWERRSPSVGMYVFDANLPILRNLRAGDGPLAQIPAEHRALLFQEKIAICDAALIRNSLVYPL